MTHMGRQDKECGAARMWTSSLILVRLLPVQTDEKAMSKSGNDWAFKGDLLEMISTCNIFQTK